MKKTLLILSGHSKGLGKAILDRFLEEKNAEIVAVSRTLLGLGSPTVREVQLDLSDLDALGARLPEIFPQENYEKVILINNAGWIGEVKPVGKLTPAGISRAVQLNLAAPMMLVNAFAERYGDRDCEKIVCNISSGAARKPMPGWAEYCSSKAGLEMFSKVAAEELAASGIRVFSLAPGIVDTEMQADIRSSDQADFPALERFQDFKSQGQLSSPETVAEKVFYLLANPGLFLDVVQDVRDFELPQ